MKACVVIPCYNEEAHIGAVVEGARRHVRDVFVIDDGSSDATVQRAEGAGAVVLRHERNLGKGVSLRDGLAKVFGEGFDAAVVLDGDAQHDPDELPHFLRVAVETGAGIVVGNRMGDTKDMPLIRYLTNHVTSLFISWLAGQRIPDSQCGYRLIRKETFPYLGFTTGRFDTEAEMLIEASRAGVAIVSIPIKTIYGSEKSSINPFRDTVRFIGLVLRFMSKRGRGKEAGVHEGRRA